MRKTIDDINVNCSMQLQIVYIIGFPRMKKGNNDNSKAIKG